MIARRTTSLPLFGLAPDEVFLAICVAAGAVSSYLTISPLPSRGRAVYFLWHSLWGHPPWALPSIPSCGARTFLTAGLIDRQARPSNPLLNYQSDCSSQTMMVPQLSQLRIWILCRTSLRTWAGIWWKQQPQAPLRTAATRTPRRPFLRS